MVDKIFRLYSQFSFEFLWYNFTVFECEKFQKWNEIGSFVNKKKPCFSAGLRVIDF